MKTFFVTGIGTGVGKTVVSAVLTEALMADYFKPIQCGNLDATDSDFIRKTIFNSTSKIHTEKYLLKKAASPHDAANAEKMKIELSDFTLPVTSNTLLIEGAGGIAVPINNNGDLVIEIAKRMNAEIILVVNYYLGCINHSILTLEYLRQYNFKIALIVFNGHKIQASKNAILKAAGNIKSIDMPPIESNAAGIKLMADLIREKMNNLLYPNGVETI